VTLVDGQSNRHRDRKYLDHKRVGGMTDPGVVVTTTGGEDDSKLWNHPAERCLLGSWGLEGTTIIIQLIMVAVRGGRKRYS
jgi:hypothetical protein